MVRSEGGEFTVSWDEGIDGGGQEGARSWTVANKAGGMHWTVRRGGSRRRIHGENQTLTMREEDTEEEEGGGGEGGEGKKKREKKGKRIMS